MPVSAELLRQMRGKPDAYDTQGLQMTPEVMTLISALLMPGAAQGAGGFAKQLPEQIGQLGQSGAVFPEQGMEFELGNLTKKDMFTEAEKQYKLWENTMKQYAQNYDFPGMLRSKWGMLKNAGGN